MVQIHSPSASSLRCRSSRLSCTVINKSFCLLEIKELTEEERERPMHGSERPLPISCREMGRRWFHRILIDILYNWSGCCLLLLGRKRKKKKKTYQFSDHYPAFVSVSLWLGQWHKVIWTFITFSSLLLSAQKFQLYFQVKVFGHKGKKSPTVWRLRSGIAISVSDSKFFCEGLSLIMHLFCWVRAIWGEDLSL